MRRGIDRERILNSICQPGNAFNQAIANGDVSAYLRSWFNRPPNGAFVQVIAAQFSSPADVSFALAGADHEVTGPHFGHFPVTEIPHAIGFTFLTDSQAGVFDELAVQFAKGSVLFEVAVGQVTNAANSGAPQLSEGDAIQIARQQATRAPGPVIGPTNPSAGTNTTGAYQLGEFVGVCVLVLAVASPVMILLRRRNRRQAAAAAALGEWSPAPFPPPTETGGRLAFGSSSKVVAAPSSGRAVAAVLERPTTSRPNMFHCGWCGEAVEIAADVVHDCGLRGGTGAYCMHCGAQFEDGSMVCGTCGNRKLQ